jgi:hypothetical protein
MPIKSKAQLGAMHAAAEGKSTIGIPKKVGKEYVAAGPAKKNLPARVKQSAPMRTSGRGR